MEKNMKELLIAAITSTEKLVITHCCFADNLLKSMEQRQYQVAAEEVELLESTFRCMNHLSITMARLQGMLEMLPLA